LSKGESNKKKILPEVLAGFFVSENYLANSLLLSSKDLENE